MRRTLLCGGLFGLAAACGHRHPPVDLPPRVAGTPHEPAGADAITVTLTADGRVLAFGRSWSLDALDAHLGRVIRSEREGYIRRSPTIARLRVDRAAPWLHVQWLVGALATHAIWQLRLVVADPLVGEADVPCLVRPPSELIRCLPSDPASVPVLAFQVEVRSDGGLRLGDRTARDARGIEPWLAEARERVVTERLQEIRAEIRPQKQAPWGAVAEIYARILARGVEAPVFTGFACPPRTVRDASRLPAPPATLLPIRSGINVWTEWPRHDRYSFDGELEEDDTEVELDEPLPEPEPIDPETYDGQR